MTESYAPSTLGPVDEVRIVDLRAVEAPRVSLYMRAHDTPAWTAQGDEAQAIATLFRRLPYDEQMRCHIPPFGLRFLRSGETVLEVSMCWKCNNAFGYAGDAEVHFSVSGDDDGARELLALLRRITA